jgi:hypothetical protein
MKHLLICYLFFLISAFVAGKLLNERNEADRTGALVNCHAPYLEWVGDGWCDSATIDDDGFDGYNSPECLYDGGDCCRETCIGGSCGVHGFDCIDPLVSVRKHI